MATMTQRYASVHDAAAYLGITEAALRQRVFRGQVPFIKEDSGRLTFDFTMLDRYLAARQRNGPLTKRTKGVTHGEASEAENA